MGCITLLTDFGREDAALAAVEGTLYSHFPDERVIDIAHDIQPFHLQQAAYLLAASHQHFPDKTIHIVLFDLFYATKPVITLIEHNDHFFIAPDNGIVPLTFRKDIKNARLCFTMTEEHTTKDWVNAVIDVVKSIQSGDWSSKYNEYTLQNTPLYFKPKISNNVLECQVIYIDRFENVVLNITRDEFEDFRSGRNFSINFMRDEVINTVSKHYNSVKEGQKLCRFNDAGYLEIAINRGEAAGLFGFRVARDNQYIYNTIKIEFE